MAGFGWDMSRWSCPLGLTREHGNSVLRAMLRTRGDALSRQLACPLPIVSTGVPSQEISAGLRPYASGRRDATVYKPDRARDRAAIGSGFGLGTRTQANADHEGGIRDCPSRAGWSCRTRSPPRPLRSRGCCDSPACGRSRWRSRIPPANGRPGGPQPCPQAGQFGAVRTARARIRGGFGAGSTTRPVAQRAAAGGSGTVPCARSFRV